MAKWAAFFQVSRSGYYDFVERRKNREQQEKKLKDEIKNLFTDSKGTYGPDRICGVLRRKGHKASYRKISRHMAEMGLESLHRQHRTRILTDSRKARGEGYPNLVRGQSFEKPYQAVCSDITYLRSGQGWTYLAEKSWEKRQERA